MLQFGMKLEVISSREISYGFAKGMEIGLSSAIQGVPDDVLFFDCLYVPGG